MKPTSTICIVTMLAAAALPSLADLALPVTSDPKAFRLRTGEGDFAAPYSETADMKVTWQDGETVSATARDGTTVIGVQSNPDAMAGSAYFTPTKGGVWTLENSSGEKAYIGVDWSLYDDNWTLAPSSAVTTKVETMEEGPNRTGKKRDFPSVAYSGDDWCGDLTQAATLTFTSPSGVVSTPTLDPSVGDGALSFRFNEAGEWTVVLGFSDGTPSRTAKITVKNAGFILIVC